jgi:hypothetical protein
MEPGDLLRCSQQGTTRAYPQLLESSPIPYVLFHCDLFHGYPSSYKHISRVVCSFQLFRLKFIRILHFPLHATNAAHRILLNRISNT